MHHAGMNNFMVIDIHTLTNRKSYGYVGNGFISEKKKKKNPRMRVIIPATCPKVILVLN